MPNAISVKIPKKVHAKLKQAAKQDKRLLEGVVEEACQLWIAKREAVRQ